MAFIFYYNATWTSLIGYPAGHGQDLNINDHHFHWGYFIHAAAFMEQFEPGWAAQWGPMVDLLIRDAASPNRNDNLFPFLRNFSPYAGHCWANGFATFPARERPGIHIGEHAVQLIAHPLGFCHGE